MIALAALLTIGSAAAVLVDRGRADDRVSGRDHGRPGAQQDADDETALAGDGDEADGNDTTGDDGTGDAASTDDGGASSDGTSGDDSTLAPARSPAPSPAAGDDSGGGGGTTE